MTNDADLREEVRNRYAEAATTVAAGAGTANDCCHPGKTCAEVGHATGRSPTKLNPSPLGRARITITVRAHFKKMGPPGELKGLVVVQNFGQGNTP